MQEKIILPKPNLNIEMSLMNAIYNRRTKRRFSDESINIQTISDILWVACGITKEAKGNTKSKRTVPSGCNSQEIKVYALTANGAYLYNEIEHSIILINESDIRYCIGSQKMMKKAPLGLVYVADLSRFKSALLKKEEAQNFTAWVDTGFLSQNVYLYCAATNLSTAALALIKREEISKLLNLDDKYEKIVITQAIGHSI